MKYFVVFLVLIGFLIPSVAFAQYQGGADFYHIPLTVDSKQYSILAQSNTNYFTGVAYDSKANSLIFSTSASEDFIDTYTITMNEQTFSELLETDYAKTPDSMLVLINGVEQPYQIFKDNEVISWRFYATTSSDEVELLPSTPRFDTGTYKFDNIPNGSPKIYPPLKQSHVGIAIENIQCGDTLVIVTRNNGSPACVTESTKEKLIERGWTHAIPINLILHDAQSWGYIKNVTILGNGYVGVTMSYPTNNAYHELYPDKYNSIVGNCDVQNDSANLSVLYLNEIDSNANMITFTKEDKIFDGMSCDDAFWDEMTQNGYCGPPPHLMSQRETLVSSIIDAQNMVDFALDVPKYLPEGYDVQKIRVDDDRKHATLFISPFSVTNETDMCAFAWSDGGIYLSYASLPEGTPRFSNDPDRERITINGNRGYVEHREIGDRAGTPIPQRSEITWHIPEGNLVFNMYSSLTSEELIKIAESIK